MKGEQTRPYGHSSRLQLRPTWQELLLFCWLLGVGGSAGTPVAFAEEPSDVPESPSPPPTLVEKCQHLVLIERDLVAARALLTEALVRALQTSSNPQWTARVYALLGMLDVLEGHPPAARRYFFRALVLDSNVWIEPEFGDRVGLALEEARQHLKQQTPAATLRISMVPPSLELYIDGAIRTTPAEFNLIPGEHLVQLHAAIGSIARAWIELKAGDVLVDPAPLPDILARLRFQPTQGDDVTPAELDKLADEASQALAEVDALREQAEVQLERNRVLGNIERVVCLSEFLREISRFENAIFDYHARLQNALQLHDNTQVRRFFALIGVARDEALRHSTELELCLNKPPPGPEAEVEVIDEAAPVSHQVGAQSHRPFGTEILGPHPESFDESPGWLVDRPPQAGYHARWQFSAVPASIDSTSTELEWRDARHTRNEVDYAAGVDLFTENILTYAPTSDEWLEEWAGGILPWIQARHADWAGSLGLPLFVGREPGLEAEYFGTISGATRPVPAISLLGQASAQKSSVRKPELRISYGVLTQTIQSVNGRVRFGESDRGLSSLLMLEFDMEGLEFRPGQSIDRRAIRLANVASWHVFPQSELRLIPEWRVGRIQSTTDIAQSHQEAISGSHSSQWGGLRLEAVGYLAPGTQLDLSFGYTMVLSQLNGFRFGLIDPQRGLNGEVKLNRVKNVVRWTWVVSRGVQPSTVADAVLEYEVESRVQSRRGGRLELEGRGAVRIEQYLRLFESEAGPAVVAASWSPRQLVVEGAFSAVLQLGQYSRTRLRASYEPSTRSGVDAASVSWMETFGTWPRVDHLVGISLSRHF